MTTKSFVKQFLRDRSEALLSMDKHKIVAYYQKYGGIIAKSEEVFWAGVHKARTALKDLPQTERRVSEKWLKQRGFSDLQPWDCDWDD